MRFSLLSMIIGSVLLTVTSQAQWLGTLSIESGYDDNMFRNYSASSSASTDLSLMFGYFPEDENWAVNYAGSLTSFSEYSDRLYSTHGLSASYEASIGDDDRNAITFLGGGSFRFDREEYMLYDYSQGLFSAALKQHLTDRIPLMLSYRGRYRVYPNFGELSYFEHFASVGTMVFFETRTSIRIQTEFGYKNYTLSNAASGDPAQGEGIMSDQTGLTLDGGGEGNGGRGESSGGGGGNGGGGNPDAPGRVGLNGNGNQGGMEASVDYLIYEEPSTSQLSTWINIGQSLGERTGISMRLRQRWNLTNRGRAFVGGAVDFIGEEELFDDPYSYESSELTVSLTKMMSWGLTLKAGGFYLLKEYDYPYTLDYSVPDVDTRNDTRAGGWITLSKALGGDWLLFSGARLSLGYVYLRNESNTSYYDYASNAVSLGMSTNF